MYYVAVMTDVVMSMDNFEKLKMAVTTGVFLFISYFIRETIKANKTVVEVKNITQNLASQVAELATMVKEMKTNVDDNTKLVMTLTQKQLIEEMQIDIDTNYVTLERKLFLDTQVQMYHRQGGNGVVDVIYDIWKQLKIKS